MLYSELIEEIQALPTEDKIAVCGLSDKYLIEERREEIYQNHLQVLEMAKKGELKFSSDKSPI